MVDATNGTFVDVDVEGPYGQVAAARYGFLGGGGDAGQPRAVIEMSAASGLQFRTDESMSPRDASTFGTGQLIGDALDRGAKHIILGLGGSATNDGGAGMAQALGVKLVDANGDPLVRGGAALLDLHAIDMSDVHPGIKGCVFEVACDVDNPLIGPRGASAIFGPQKGATREDVASLDRALERLATVTADFGFHVDADHPGAGAAGGLGFGALTFLSAKLTPGIDVVIKAVGLRAALDGADLLITGEGQIDRQTLSGKTPFGAMRVATEAGVPTIAMVGRVGPGADEVIDAGMTAIFSIVPGPTDVSSALESTRANLQRTARNIAALWQARGFD